MKSTYPNRIIVDIPKQYDTATHDSFARGIIKNNYPNLLKEMSECELISKSHSDELLLLSSELKNGTVKKPIVKNSLSIQWNDTGKKHFKREWLDLPSYWAESYFFYRIGEIFGYTSTMGSFEDPFLFKKILELRSDKLNPLLDKCDFILKKTDDKETAIYDSLVLALIGNMADLSHDISNNRNNVKWNEGNILSNDIGLIINKFINKDNKYLIYVADNSGEELVFDLLLCAVLLKYNIFDNISIHLKPYPFFVSDATLFDAQCTITEMPDSSSLKKILIKFINNGKLNFETDYFYASPYFMYQMPQQLWNKFKKSSCAIYKGDLNYRRLLGDARWDTSTDFKHVTSYFPTSLIALRVMKSDIAVGIPNSISSSLEIDDSAWKYNGIYSVIQTKL